MSLTLKLTELKINTLLKLFNERTGHKLELVLTLNEQDNTLRGYAATGFRTGEEVIHFIDLLKLKGVKAKPLQEHNFIVHVDAAIKS
ncbi:MAG: hypothetical protein Q9M50_11000 [Methylococcales bacterium]|nr:hypothetical protein [Methylococcales bacterium]